MQPVKDADVACAVTDQVLLFPSMVQVTVLTLLPLVGVVSGSGEVNVIVDGVAVTTAGLTANAKFFKIRLTNTTGTAARRGVCSAALAVAEIKQAQSVSRNNIFCVPFITR